MFGEDVFGARPDGVEAGGFALAAPAIGMDGFDEGAVGVVGAGEEVTEVRFVKAVKEEAVFA